MSETEVQKHARELSELKGRLKEAEEKYKKLDDEFNDMESHYLHMAGIFQDLIDILCDLARDIHPLLDKIEEKNAEIQNKYPDATPIKRP